MKKLLLLPIALVIISACSAGPSKLSRQFDDYRNQKYVDSSWGATVLTDVLPVYPIVSLGAALVDGIILNPIQFWGTDAWQQNGQGFIHTNPTIPEGGSKTGGIAMPKDKLATESSVVESSEAE